MSVFCIYLYKQLQQRGLPEARSRAAPWQGRVQYFMAKAGVRPIYHSANHTPPSPRLHLGRAGRRVGLCAYNSDLHHCNHKWRARSQLYSRSTFLGISGPKNFQVPPLPMVLVMDLPTSKSLRPAPYEQ
jgi:hypothetical protein